MSWYKKAKHITPISHYCIYCKTNIVPHSFSRNQRHHFPWGIVYKCDCGKSGLWSNSIRGNREFLEHVFEDKPLEDFPYLEGFCNDLFCPICFSIIQILKNGLDLDLAGDPMVYIPESEKKYYYLSDYDAYIRSYNKDVYNPTAATVDAPYIGEEADVEKIARRVDVAGCLTLAHNIGIIRRGYEFEYGEGEYQPIYDWIKANKSRIPTEMIDELKS